MGRLVLGSVAVATAGAAAVAVLVHRRVGSHRDFLLFDDDERRRAEASVRYYNEVGDPSGF
jgi:hypothetical protein